MDHKALNIIHKKFALGQSAVLDLGCGYGHFLKRFGPGSIGITTDMREVEFGKIHSLPIRFGNAESLDKSIGEKVFSAIWANNLFEHLLAPHAFLMNLKKLASPEAVLILGVPVVPIFPWLMRFGKFRGALATNHINFFTTRTLCLTVERGGWEILEARPFIFKNPLLDRLAKPFAPHLYVAAKNITNFKYPEKKVNEWRDERAYASMLEITGQK